jgi:alpha-L-arabinofuranosidase
MPAPLPSNIDTEPYLSTADIAGRKIGKILHGTILISANLADYNTFEKPQTAVPATFKEVRIPANMDRYAGVETV